MGITIKSLTCEDIDKDLIKVRLLGIMQFKGKLEAKLEAKP